MQRIILGKAHDVNTQVNKLLEQGWRVVPGTIVLHNEEYVPGYDPGREKSANKTVYTLIMAVVLQEGE